MIVVDVNVLVPAFREDHPDHAGAYSWLSDALSAAASSVVVPDLVWVGFVRIVTHRRVFAVPSPLVAVQAFVSAVRSSPGYHGLEASGDIIDEFLRLAVEADAVGNLVPDAYIAAVARSYACPVATFDRDFRRFDRLQLVEPGA